MRFKIGLGMLFAVAALAISMCSAGPEIGRPVVDEAVSVDTGYIPSPEHFVMVEIYPEMIYEEPPEYPKIAKQEGITGVVWIKSLVDEKGNVMDAFASKTSGHDILDAAAVAAAFKCRYKPGQNKRKPIKVWVTYKVVFDLH